MTLADTLRTSTFSSERTTTWIAAQRRQKGSGQDGKDAGAAKTRPWLHKSPAY